MYNPHVGISKNPLISVMNQKRDKNIWYWCSKLKKVKKTSNITKSALQKSHVILNWKKNIT